MWTLCAHIAFTWRGRARRPPYLVPIMRFWDLHPSHDGCCKVCSSYVSLLLFQYHLSRITSLGCFSYFLPLTSAVSALPLQVDFSLLHQRVSSIFHICLWIAIVDSSPIAIESSLHPSPESLPFWDVCQQWCSIIYHWWKKTGFLGLENQSRWDQTSGHLSRAFCTNQWYYEGLETL